MAGRQPPIPEDWVYESPWARTLIPGDGEANTGTASTVIGGVNQFGKDLMGAATVNPYTWPGWLVGAGLEGLTEAPKKYLAGDDVTVGDAGLFAAEAVPGIWGLGKAAVRGIRKGMGHLALPQDITRRRHAYENPIQKGERSGDWYHGTAQKAVHMGKMAARGIWEPVRRLYDVNADALYRKHGISASQRAEFERAFKWEDGHYDAAGNKVKNPRQSTNKNEYISNAQYIESILQKYFPGNTKFTNEMRQMLFPRTVQTNGASMAESALPIKQIFGDVFGQASDNDILTHISRPIVGKHNLGDKQVLLNSRPWAERSPVATVTSRTNRRQRVGAPHSEKKYHGANAKFNPSATALDVMRYMPEGPVNFTQILAAISRNNDDVRSGAIKIEREVADKLYKKDGTPRADFSQKFNAGMEKKLKTHYSDNPLISIEELYEGMQETDRFISFDGRILGEDRLLANYNHRLIIDKDSGEMYMLTFDEMRQGTGFGTIDNILNAGTPEGISVDITPIIRGKKDRWRVHGTESTAAKQVGAGSRDAWAAQIREGMEDMMNYDPTMGDYAKFAAKSAAVHGGAVAGYGLLNED